MTEPILGITMTIPHLRADDERIERLFGLLENDTGQAMDWYSKQSGGLVKVTDRIQVFNQGIAESGYIPMFCNGSVEDQFFLNVWNYDSVIGPGGTPIAMVDISLPYKYLENRSLTDIVAVMGDALLAWHGGLMPSSSSHILTRTQARRKSMPESNGLVNPQIERKLRMIPRGRKLSGVPGPEIPTKLQWINYWSAQTCERMCFPKVIQPEHMIHSRFRTSRDAWVFQMTEKPLDLTQEAHIDILINCYELFPDIGGRKMNSDGIHLTGDR